jgi:ABC-type nitrate/sulfonate/bicarbonate transport system substrate-binding protein
MERESMSHSPRVRTTVIATLTAFALLLAGCGGDDEATAPPTGSGAEQPAAASTEPESDKLTIIAAPVEFDSVTDAKWIELLEEAGITVELKEVEFGPDTTRALVAGEGDIASNSPVPTLQYIIQSGGGLKVIAAEVLGTDYVLLTTPDISSFEDLVGKKVGISEPGDISDSLTRVMLTKAGADPKDFEFPQIGGTSDRIAALTAKQIQGGAAHVADALTAVQAAGLKPLTNYWEHIPVYAQRFVAASDKWLEENPNLAQLAVDKLIEANQWAVENKEEYIALSKEFVEEMPDDIREEVYDIFLENDFFAPDGGLDAIEPTIEVEREQGTLSGELPPTSEWVDSSFVENSAAGSGG